MPAISFGVQNLISIFGIGVIIGIAWLFSRDRSAINWKTVRWGLGLQFLFAVLILGTGFGETFFAATDAAFTRDADAIPCYLSDRKGGLWSRGGKDPRVEDSR